MIFFTSGPKVCLNCLNSMTMYINSLYPRIKYELVYSDNFLHVLDLTLHLKDGLIVTDIYSKPTDSHLYLPFSSSHPSHCKKPIPYGVALKIKCNYSTDDFLQTKCEDFKGYLKSQNYPADIVDKQFDKALKIPRSELLKKVFLWYWIIIPFCQTFKTSLGSTFIY